MCILKRNLEGVGVGLVNKKKWLFTLFVNILVCASLSAETDVKTMYSRLLSYADFQVQSLSKEDQKNEIERYQNQILAELSQAPDDPVYLYLKGLVDWAQVYSASGIALSKDNKRTLILNAQKEFSKAFVSNKNNYNYAKLIKEMLFSMESLSDPGLSIEINRYLFSIDAYGGSELELDMRGGVVNRLLHLKRYNEVILEIGEIERRFPNSNSAKNLRPYMEELIERSKAEPSKSIDDLKDDYLKSQNSPKEKSELGESIHAEEVLTLNDSIIESKDSTGEEQLLEKKSEITAQSKSSDAINITNPNQKLTAKLLIALLVLIGFITLIVLRSRSKK